MTFVRQLKAMTKEQEILNKINDQSTKINEMHIVVAGNPKYGQKGLKDTIQDYGIRLDNLETRMDTKDKSEFKKNVVIGFLSGGSGVGVGLFGKSGVSGFFKAMGALWILLKGG